MNNVHPFRLLIKSLILYGIANLVFAWFSPPLGGRTLYNWLVRGRERVPYEREVDYYPIAHTIPVFEDMDAMYNSHVLSQPKLEDEFRVFLVGDSSAWGFQLLPQQTLAGQINSLQVKSCDGRRVVAYNAAFPLPYLMKDLMLMDKLREFEPDLFLWRITLDAFRNRSIFTDYFLDPHSNRVRELVEEYGIENLDLKKLKVPTLWDRTIIGQRVRLKRMLMLQVHGIGWQATGVDFYFKDYPPLEEDQSEDETFFEVPRGELHLDSQLFDVLGAGYQLAGEIPLLVINEPIYISTGKNKEIRYNEFYPRWAFDEYLVYLDQWMDDGNHEYVNAWNVIPPSEFTDTPFHLTPRGEEMLARILAPEIEKLACAQGGHGIDD